MELQALFIGNSHTYLHYMPHMFAEMVQSSGKGTRMHVEQSLGRGVSLEWHWHNPGTRELLASRRWNYVVLQDRSRGPLENRSSFETYARLLDVEIRRQGGRTVLYMTWADRSQPETQAVLAEAYTTISRNLGALLCPVGLAWQAALKLNPALNLHHADGRHASPAGSYLAACLFYAVILRDSPLGMPRSFKIKGKLRPDVPQEEAMFLQQIAWDTIAKNG
jgi:hypothetical protein